MGSIGRKLGNAVDGDGYVHPPLEYTHIIVQGAREHNLRNLDLQIPKEKFVVISGVSGSGKSSLAFDTLYVEGKRRYVECLSPYARQFLGILEKPDVDLIEGLSPAIAIDQKTAGTNPRSTVGTLTEIYDYLRLLFAKLGVQHCVDHPEVPVEALNEEEILQKIFAHPSGTKIQILAPLVRGRKGHYRALFEQLRKAGFAKVRVDGTLLSLEPGLEVSRYKVHNIDLVVDRIVLREAVVRQRVIESLRLALNWGKGSVIVVHYDEVEQQWREALFNIHLACPVCQRSYEPLAPHHFSFNSPRGACPACEGLGVRRSFHPEFIVSAPEKSLVDGAIELLGRRRRTWLWRLVEAVAAAHQIDLQKPFAQLPKSHQRILLYGTGRQYAVKLPFDSQPFAARFPGLLEIFQQEYERTESIPRLRKYERYMAVQPCPTCQGQRLRPESLAVKFAGKNIAEIAALSVTEALAFFQQVRLSSRERKIAGVVLKEIIDRLGFLEAIGVGYLSLNRPANTLSGGEAQRIRLAAQIGAQLVGVLYVLDEPSIGLHPSDNQRLIRALKALRDLGNTVIVVEHDRDTIEAADYLIDLGPGAGIHGGDILYAGPLKQRRRWAKAKSLTLQYLAGRRHIAVPKHRRTGNGKVLRLVGASGNNLQHITVEFPLGCFICVTGKSGSGKSTLVNDTLYPILARRFHNARLLPLPYERLEGWEHLNKVVVIDQSPIGRTMRSNPATYTGVFTEIRKLFAQLPEARIRGYTASRFSFNLSGGRCEACQGMGLKTIEMHFLPSVTVPCEFCDGKRYNAETLQVRYRGYSIADVLEMTIAEARELFQDIPAIQRYLRVLDEIGLGYLRLGQPAPMLSGGEAQRVKLASELTKVATGKTLYILDEPTTGLHFEDIRVLLHFLHQLVDRGNTVIVIEHNLDVIKTADWIIDLGPEGGARGGKVVAVGTPEEIAQNGQSVTGRYLRSVLSAT